jgi:hypothetical protein
MDAAQVVKTISELQIVHSNSVFMQRYIKKELKQNIFLALHFLQMVRVNQYVKELEIKKRVNLFEYWFTRFLIEWTTIFPFVKFFYSRLFG